MAPLPALVALLPGIPLVPPPALEPGGPPARIQPHSQPANRPVPLAPGQGDWLEINGWRQRARWRIERGELWLPLEVLDGQLGVSRSPAGAEGLELEWFGVRVPVPPSQQRSLDDEVAVPTGALLRALGVRIQQRQGTLELQLPAAELLAVRSRDQGLGQRRVVLDLAAPALVRSGDGRLQLAIRSTAEQRGQLRQLGLDPNDTDGWLSLRAPEARRLSLASPWRLVLDMPAEAAASADQPPSPPRDPRLLALQQQGLQLQRQVVRQGDQQLLLHSVQLDPRQVPLELRPLRRPSGMQGLSSLNQLARQGQALIAINGGYFNRVNRLPLGAMRHQGRWLSGPILNRGAIGWSPGELPQFDRLSLEESVEDEQRQRWPIGSVNSGYVQKGLARYTADWGPLYQPITGTEMGVLVRSGRVVRRYEQGELDGGVPLAAGDLLIVARGGTTVPWQDGEALSLRSRASSPLGLKPHVMGGGPLLLQNGRVVLNGGAEGFTPGFLQQGAPRTVVGSDGRQLWLITLQGLNGPGPTLWSTAQVLRQLGLVDALNLDGGSSTGLVVADVQTVMGRGVAAAVHNGLGLVPRQP
ncbi:MAG: phosphodiester glycosidase family protein [Synechococcaceae bacterium WBB_3_034]|nr:phosphodiester glycosidase family protein [Synechococcaceae bacterium WBB_3_034]